MKILPNASTSNEDVKDDSAKQPKFRLRRCPYIAIEGVNLSGKSTAVNYVKEHSEFKDKIAVYHEPDENTLLGKFVRDNVSKENKINDYIVKNTLYLLGIKENTFTSFKYHMVHLSSRSILSNIVYSELEVKDSIRMINTLKVKIPDLTIMIHIPRKLLEKRLNESSEKDVAESKGLNYLMKKQENMEHLLFNSKLYAHSQHVFVDYERCINDGIDINKKILECVDNIIKEFNENPRARYNKSDIVNS